MGGFVLGKPLSGDVVDYGCLLELILAYGKIGGICLLCERLVRLDSDSVQ